MDEKKALSRWFAETANWFVLFVRTREEHRIAEWLQARLDAGKYKVFVPTRDYAHTKNKETTVVKKPLFNGYLFIAATVEAEECLKTVEPLFYCDPSIYKLLSNDDRSNNIQLSIKDKTLMTSILNNDFNVPALQAVADGDWVQVNGDMFSGLDAEIVKVNKRRQTAVIRMLFDGKRTDCEIALEFLASPKKS